VVASLVLIAGFIGLVWNLMFRRFVELRGDRDPDAWLALGSIASGGYRASRDADLVRHGDQLRMLFVTDIVLVAAIVATVLAHAEVPI